MAVQRGHICIQWVEAAPQLLDQPKGNAGSMEVSGVKAMFLRSVSNRNPRYTTYLGDGDSKSHQEVVNLKPYLDHDIVKEECTGYVQKGVGARLWTHKAQYKVKLLFHKKKFSGIGRCTNKVMNTLQNYYGMIIRSNVANLYGMKKGYRYRISLVSILS